MEPQKPSTEDHYAQMSAATAAAVRQLPHDVNLSEEILTALVERLDIVEREEIPGATLVGGQQPALIGRFRFLIRNDRILTLKSILDGIKAAGSLMLGALGLHAGASLPGAKGLVDGIIGIYQVLSDTIARGIVLPPEEFAMVAALRRVGSASADTIAQMLKDSGGPTHPDAAAVEAFLCRCQLSIENPHGFTRQAPDGSWALVKI